MVNVLYGDREAHVRYLDFEVNSFVPQSFVLLMLLNTFTIKKLGYRYAEGLNQACLVIFMEL